MKYFFMVVVFFSLTFNHATATSLDSLLNVRKKLEKRNKNDTTLAKVYNNLALKYIWAAKPDSVLFFAEKALSTSKEINWQYGQGTAHKWMGHHYIFLGKYQVALQSFFESLYIFEQLKNVAGQANALRRIADMYSLLLQTEEAKEYYERALQMYTVLGDVPGEAICLHNMGNNYRRAKQYGKAIEYHQLSLPKYLTFASEFALADTYEEMAIAYGKLQDYKRSEFYFLKAKEIINSSESKEFNTHLLSFLSEMYVESAQYQKALNYGKKAFGLSTELKQYDHVVQSANTLYMSFKELGQEDSAMYYLEKKVSAKELIEASNKERELESLKFEYENKKQKELTKSQKEALNLRTNQLYLLCALLLLVAAFLYFLYRNNRTLKLKNSQIENQRKELNLAKTDLEKFNQTLEQRVALRTQELQEANIKLIQKNKEIEDAMFKGQTFERKRVADELHDNLGSQVSAIRWSLMAIDKENLSGREKRIYENVMQMMNNTYTEIRNISHNLLPEEFDKNGLTGALNLLVSQLNQSENIFFDLEMDSYESLPKKVEFEMYSIILELVTNILKHAQADEVVIEVIRDMYDKTIIQVTDNGTGFDKNTTNAGKGLNSLRERASRINAKLGYSSREGKTNFCIILT